MSNVIIAAAIELIKQNGSTTQQEVKNFFERVLPEFKVSEIEIQDTLRELHETYGMSLRIDGTYDIYTKKTYVRLRKIDLAAKLLSTKGEEIEAEFSTKNKSRRIIKGVVVSNTVTGLVGIVSNDEFRNFYLERLHWFKHNGIRYVL